MKTWMVALIGGVALVVVVILIFFGMMIHYKNAMVTSSNNVRNQIGDLQSAYQRRSDLIPNIVATAQGEANFEKSTLEGVINARAKATQVQINANSSTQDLQQFQQSQGALSSSLSRLLVTVEAYPTLKANQAFENLITELEGTENRINVSRRDYNAAVTDYRNLVQKFPASLFAGGYDANAFPFFQSDPGAQNAPKVTFPTSSPN